MAILLNLSNPTDQQAEQILQLYRQAGWWEGSTDDDTGLTRKIVCGSYLFIAAVENDEIVGMGRAISDGISDAYIQDVTVSNEYRGQGLASQIINLLIRTLHQQNIHWIGVIAESDTHLLYEKLGFSRMPQSTPLLHNNPK